MNNPTPGASRRTAMRVAPSMRVKLTIPKPGKANGKVGPIPMSTTTAASCPDCPFKGRNGCYAESYPVKGVWDKVTSGVWGTDWDTFCAQIAALPEGQAWRHNQAGDLPGKGNAIDTVKLNRLVDANQGRMGFTYTHKPVSNAVNRAAIADANARGFVVNMSANTLAEADRLASLGIAPVVVVLATPEGEKADTVTPGGRRVVTCPATYREGVTCASCLLCARKRRTIVGFPVHGIFKKAAAAVARGKAH